MMYDLRTRFHAAWLVRILFHPIGETCSNLETILNNILWWEENRDHTGWQGFRRPQDQDTTALSMIYVEWYNKHHFKRLDYLYHDAYHLMRILEMLDYVPDEVQQCAIKHLTYIEDIHGTDEYFFPIAADSLPFILQQFNPPLVSEEVSTGQERSGESQIQ